MEWIHVQLQKLRARHKAKTQQIAKQNTSQKATTRVTPKAANANKEKAKLQAVEIGKALKAKGATSLKQASKISAPSAGGKKPTTSTYSPKGLPSRGKGKGKGRSR